MKLARQSFATIFILASYATPQTVGQGRNVAPEIAGSQRANVGYLLLNVVDPSAAVAKATCLGLTNLKTVALLWESCHAKRSHFHDANQSGRTDDRQS